MKCWARAACWGRSCCCRMAGDPVFNSPRYDAGMKRAKITTRLPKGNRVVAAEPEERESLRRLLRGLVDQYGEPADADIQWALRVLTPRKGSCWMQEG